LNALIDESDKRFSKIQNSTDQEDGATKKSEIDEVRTRLEGKISALDDERYKVLSERKEKAEKHYQLCSQWSVITYLLGWTVALIGHWFGVKGLSAE
jgi:hypothetical protein